jgi:hypothetical protein
MIYTKLHEQTNFKPAIAGSYVVVIDKQNIAFGDDKARPWCKTRGINTMAKDDSLRYRAIHCKMRRYHLR